MRVCACADRLLRGGGWVVKRLSEREEEASETIEALENRMHTHSHTQTLGFREDFTACQRELVNDTR